ncbi:MAG TPA: FAD-dependent monooxygenase [Candidatus Binatia bacterium]|nr:FAD-dependent monooxygenase [Candidatus Binatia bacterium]
MTPKDARVLIVGAGPTGLLLAAELHRRGVPCRLIDAHDAPLHWDRATVVHPRSLEVFESLGILDPFLAIGVKQRTARLHSGGDVLGVIDLATCGSRHGFNLGISEEVTESILTDYLRRRGGDVMRATRLVALEQRRDGIVAAIESGGAHEETSVDWVVGCDGLHSTTRELSGIDLAGHDIPEPWAVFDVTLRGWSEPFEANYAYLEAIPVILTALPKERWRVYLRPSGPDSDLVADALATIGRYHPEVAFDGVANPTRFHCHTKVATRYRSGRVLLAGDAAHVCSPSQGHGMNSGLQDAFNLAWKLALVCSGESSADLLDSYEVERRPVAETITASGDAAEHAHTLVDPAERRARDRELRRVFADPTSRHHEVIAEAELDIDYSASPIVMGDTDATLHPGGRLPDTVPVRFPNGERCFLHELAHRAGHTALVIAGSCDGADGVAGVEESVRAAADPSVIETTVVLASEPSDERWPRLDGTTSEALGVDGIAVLAVRPDGHVGLRADRDHARSLVAYQSLLRSGRR